MTERSLTVAFETSARQGSVAVSIDGEERDATLDAAGSHAQDLLPALLSLLGTEPTAMLSGHRLERVFVGLGPGSYTGLRVGIATALGLAYGGGAALRGVPSFETLALAQLTPGETACIVQNARADRFYFARYEREADDVREVHAPSALPKAELLARLSADERILGDASSAQDLALDPDRITVAHVPHAIDLLRLGPRRLHILGPHTPNEVEPLYCREFGER